MGQRMMRLFAVKVMFGETSIDEFRMLMYGARWWQPGMGDLEDELAARMKEMESLMETKLPRWNLAIEASRGRD